MQNYQTIGFQLLSLLSGKPREIISRRFGLQNEQSPQTLQEIGSLLDLTRERIRQIETESLKKLSKAVVSDKQARAVVNNIKNRLQMSGGFKREDLLASEMARNGLRNYFLFFLNITQGLFRFPSNNEYCVFWANDKNAPKHILPLLDKITLFFKDLKKPVTKKDIYNLLVNKNQNFVDSLIEVSQKVSVGPLGEVGLTAWPDIKPRGARDAAYLVLKQAKTPLHFKEVARIAKTMNGEFFQRKKMLPQTVHNELIKDPQFILVGRGVYSLKGWGYEQGTVKEVIANVLKDSREPLSKEQIFREVSRRKVVQPNTIFLNLANRQHFLRDSQGRYTLKEV